MPRKTPKQLSEESKRHSDKALEHFKEATQMYEEMKEMPLSPERDKAFRAVLEKDDEAIAESERAMEINREFLDQVK
jgi:hypothetical protein